MENKSAHEPEAEVMSADGVWNDAAKLVQVFDGETAPDGPRSRHFRAESRPGKSGGEQESLRSDATA